MQPARIAELLEPFVEPDEGTLLTAGDLTRISTYIDLLLRWNARINLTAIRNEEEIVTRHFGESLFAARHLYPRSSSAISAPSALKDFAADLPHTGSRKPEAGSRKLEARVADIGSGAGFPGIPIKLWAPHVELTLIESNHKKATFLREVARALTLTSIDIQSTRAESLAAEAAPRFDVVTMRAVEHFAAILPTAASLLVPGGRLLLLLGHSQQAQAESLLPAMSVKPAIPVPLSSFRILLIATSLVRQESNQSTSG